MFEGIAKTNTTNTLFNDDLKTPMFEGIAKTNTTNTQVVFGKTEVGLRVLLKQIQQTQGLALGANDCV